MGREPDEHTSPDLFSPPEARDASPPPGIIEEHNNACFIVRDATGQAIGYFYFEEWQ